MEKAISSDTSTFVFKSVILIAFAAYAEAWSYGIYIENNPGKFTLGLFLLLVIRILLGSLSVNTKDRVLKEDDNSQKNLEENWNAGPKKFSIFTLLPKLNIPPLVLPVLSIIFSFFALSSGDIQGKIFAKLDRYVSAGKGVALQTQNKEKGYSLSYLDVFSTVRSKWYS